MPETLAGPPTLPLGYEFHHLGYATESLEREIRWLTMIGYEPEGAEFSDPVQGIMGCFLVGIGPRIELLQNLSGKNTLTPWLSQGIRIYHFAYLVQDVPQAVAWARGLGAKVTVPAVSAVAFEKRPISFVMLRNGMMLEFIGR